LVTILRRILQVFDPLKLGEVTEEKLEECRKMVVCVRLLIFMKKKLELRVSKEIGELIEMAVFYFTPLPAEFQPYYLHFNLLQNGTYTAPYLLLFLADLEEAYKELICEVMWQVDVSGVYWDILERRLV
jgi:hypothetical protein